MNFLDKKASLLPNSKQVICEQATEAPYSGTYNQFTQKGSYLCRRCGLALYRGENQFNSHCGWPAFDEEIPGAVKALPDKDGVRVEITCARCQAHLGHVFQGEQFTQTNTRHCVNSLSLDFVADSKVKDSEEIIVAGGCFWGVDHFLSAFPGVLKVEAGYTGGHVPWPSYEQVCQGQSGHYEAIRVLYDVEKTDCSALYQRFFEIHDPTQISGQGGDIGQQYQSAIFYYNEDQKTQATALIQKLEALGYKVATKLLEAQIFWPAEDYHQNYYAKHQKLPYCHAFVPRFKGPA